MIILQVTKYQGFTLSLEDTFLEDRYIFRKPQGWGVKLTPPPPPLPSRFRVKQSKNSRSSKYHGYSS